MRNLSMVLVVVFSCLIPSHQRMMRRLATRVLPANPVTFSIPWVDGTRQYASADRVEAFERFVSEEVATLGSPFVATAPLTDTAVLEVIHRVQERVERQADLPLAWRWGAVREEVRNIGREAGISLRSDARGAQGSPLTYEVRMHTILIHDAAWVTSHSLEEVARVILHEVTHGVFRSEVLRSSGYTPDEWAVMCLRCYDIFLSQSLATEAVAFVNEAAWVESVGGMDLPEGKRRILEAALAFRRGEEDGAHSYAGIMLAYAYRVFRELVITSSIRLQCGAPIVWRGTGRGHLYLPSQPAPELIDPLFNEVAYYHANIRPFGLPEPEHR